MPAPIKVLPVAPEDVGLVHPVDGALAAAGSLWSYDTFTVRMLDAGVIRRFEVGVDDAKPAAAAPPPEGAPAAGPAPVAPAPAADPAAPAAAKK